jgi:hypothetical protein
MNKQKGEKKTAAYFTGLINMLIEANAKGYSQQDRHEVESVART